MKSLRRWHLDASQLQTLEIAADARLSRTDYTDDQIWEFSLGKLEEPALALHTRYGGRVGLASIVPMWNHQGRIIYQAQAYTEPPYLIHFAPGYAEAHGRILPHLEFEARCWCMESHAIGAQYILRNSSEQAETIHLDLFAHVGAEGKSQKLGIVHLDAAHHALHMGQIGSLNPVVFLENASATSLDGKLSSKIGVDLKIEAGKSVIVRWVHAGLTDIKSSLALARAWLEQGWKTHFEQVELAANRIPEITSNDEVWNQIIARSYHRLAQSFLQPTSTLPHSSFVTTRLPAYGSEPNRTWDGQEPTAAYLAALAMATIDPAAAQGIVRNYLAVQHEDGWIDRKPGLGGQRQNLLNMPVLARLSWNLYESTQDSAFLKESFPKLMKFFDRWFRQDHDLDEDGFPEWRQERQTGYIAFPTFAMSQNWSQGADVRFVESPDLAAYLLSEAQSLRRIAKQIGEKSVLKSLDKQIDSLHKHLDALWNGQFYGYRDAATHTTIEAQTLLSEARGDEIHELALKFKSAQRLVIRITGGVSHVPRLQMTLKGVDSNGSSVTETAESGDFLWQNRQGVYTSRHAYAEIASIQFGGLSRVYKLDVQTLGTNRLDINALLPLCAEDLPVEKQQRLLKLARDPDHFYRKNGITMVSAQDKQYDPSNAQGGGGIWPFWFALVCEGLIESGEIKVAAQALKQFMDCIGQVYQQIGNFSEFYHADQPEGSGIVGHLNGIVPLHLLSRVMGVRILDTGKLWAGGPFYWDGTWTIKQHGLTVKRSKKGVKIAFPSGHKVELGADAEWQLITDPKPTGMTPLKPILIHPPKEKSGGEKPKTVTIEVQYEE